MRSPSLKELDSNGDSGYNGDTTGRQLTAYQICFKEYIKYLKYNGDSGHNGDTTYSASDLLQGIHKISKV